MHPNPLFRKDDRARLDALLGEIGFGLVFLTTPQGPRVAHVPLVSDETGTIQFHLARNNALTPHLNGARALVSVNGPHGYVSPRWYDNRDTVPTWDYAAVEIEGPVRRLTETELEALLHRVIETFEQRLDGARWLAAESSDRVWSGLFRGIAGFALDAEQWRPTFKLSQKKSAEERARIADGLEAAGNAALARMIREESA